ncbi:unnamed protein product [Adineta ricciae]|uniref:Uncharacterized protein n=1 Tax=Adineta ricciae TaxID=249248 RepID=A0A815FBJ4_ADIRI|nr:unnamed protein product [Adineta ricciae]CAF1323264.1 unnamed protein product [Adineta ricciae]
MSCSSSSNSINKQVIISLHGYSHEVCVAITHAGYWQQLIRKTDVSINFHGKYIPKEVDSICNELRLQLIIQIPVNKDKNQIDLIVNRICHDLILFDNYDEPVYDVNNRQMLVFGSLFNSLPIGIFSFERNLLGEDSCKIKELEHLFECTINVDKLSSNRYRFRICHEHFIIMDLVAIQIQSIVKQVQHQYVIAFGRYLKQTLFQSMERSEVYL